MANTDVESYNYNYAKECYMVYYAGKTTDPKYLNGKAVAESETWKSYIISWQSQDIVDYTDPLDDVESAEDQTSTKNGSLGTAIAGGAVGSAIGTGTAVGASMVSNSLVLTGTSIESIMAQVGKYIKNVLKFKSGTIVASAIYAAFGIGFVVMTSVMINKVIKDRGKQGSYVNETDKMLEYDFNSKLGEAETINESIIAYQEEIMGLTESAKEEINLTDLVSGAMSTSHTMMSASATAVGDETAGGAGEEIDALCEEMLTLTANYDVIIEEVDGQKILFDEINKMTSEHIKNRKDCQKAMLSLGIGAGIAAVTGGIGLGLAWTNGYLAPIAIGLYIAGIAAFGTSSILAFVEHSKQKNSLDAATTHTEKTNTKIEKALNTADETRQIQSQSQTAYASASDMGSKMEEENSNYTGEAA